MFNFVPNLTIIHSRSTVIREAVSSFSVFDSAYFFSESTYFNWYGFSISNDGTFTSSNPLTDTTMGTIFYSYDNLTLSWYANEVDMQLNTNHASINWYCL